MKEHTGSWKIVIGKQFTEILSGGLKSDLPVISSFGHAGILNMNVGFLHKIGICLLKMISRAEPPPEMVFYQNLCKNSKATHAGEMSNYQGISADNY